MQTLPFGREGRFYRGNLHTHSTRSDGRLPPEEVMRTYREAGYDFLVLSDHFMERYDYPVTDTTAMRTRDFVPVIGAELHAPRTAVGELWHIHAVGLPLDFAPPAPGETGPELARRAAAAGAFIGINHPSWYGLTVEDALTVEVAHAVEIYNHGSHIEVDRGVDWPFLDALLNAGKRLTGYATDDAHLWHDDAFGGWVQVHADRGEPEALVESLKAGRYYSSQGPVLHDVEIDGDRVRVRCSPAVAVAATGRGAKSEQQRGSDLTDVTLPIDRFRPGYLRLTVIDADGRRAWTNPVWLD
ncbi:MAG: CehA/McbA family metallohydrolase [Ectothiorhodospiraceae bacterium]|nr:CehA/McbA family metallohydrolase [Planctomycetota bacterium]MCP5151764.1 CehA/McbA family metallohydrolase [Chromatiales bacterium]MCP5154295.1 CehA/McbA family metallohydrolase [Ectothiorhodospiraceae bacterium]